METNLVINEYCPRDCRYLNITEKRQDELKNLTGVNTHHKCMKYNVRLYHMLAHPDLYKCEECFKEEENNE